MKNSLKIIPLGGIEEIGKNCTLLEYKEEIIIIDCGIKFHKERLFGNLIYYPDFNYLKKNSNKIKGVFITHGHLDHIGGLPFLLEEFNPPIYTSSFSKDLIENLFKKRNIKYNNINNINSIIKFKFFTITPIFLKHSIIDAMGFLIENPQGNIFITGDFNNIEKKELELLKKKNIDILLSDSTNANKKKIRNKEGEIYQNLLSTIKNSQRVLVGQFSSQIYIIKDLLKIAKNLNRILIPIGRSIEDIFYILEKNQDLKNYLNNLGRFRDVNKYSPKKLILLTTGSQGEKNSSLWKLAHNKMSNIKIQPKDTLILSASVIPGNEIYVDQIINSFYKQGARVITNDDLVIHSSGHSYKDELKKSIKEIKPHFFVPVHGEMKHLIHHKNIALECGISEKNIFILENGRKLEINNKSGILSDRLKLKNKIINNNRLIDDILIQEKQSIAEKGFLLFSICKQKNRNLIKVNSLGLINPDEKSKIHLQLEKIILRKDLIVNSSEKIIKKNILKELNLFLSSKKIIKPDFILFNFLN